MLCTDGYIIHEMIAH